MSRFKRVQGLSRLSDSGGGVVEVGIPLPLLRMQNYTVTSPSVCNGSVFSRDGKNAYYVSTGGPSIVRFESANPFSFDGATVTTSDSIGTLIGSDASGATCLRLHPNGLHLFTLVVSPTIKIVKMGLAAGGSVSSVSLIQSASIPLTTPNNQGSHFIFQKDDPSKLIMFYDTGTSCLLQKYQLPGEYDLSSSPVLIGSKTIGKAYGPPVGLDSLTDGNTLFVTFSPSGSLTEVRRIDLSSPWDVSTASVIGSASSQVANVSSRGFTMLDAGSYTVRFSASSQAIRGLLP